MPKTLRLYHFLRAEHALRAMEAGRLKAANLDEVNDPYECLTVGFSSGDEEKAFLKLREEVVRRLVVVCFSETYREPLLWGHYAERFRGVCLAFDARLYGDAMENYVSKVKYTEGRKELAEFGMRCVRGRIQCEDPFKIRDLLSIKSHHWKYEREWRVWVNGGIEPDPVTNLRFLAFSDQIILREVLVGYRCSEDMIRRIGKMAANYLGSPKPTLTLTRRSLSTFDIERVT